MKPNTTKEDNLKFVRARLDLARALLEESDSLPGRSGYDFGAEEWWRHPRHEREALVNYLLLTCFDRLGQDRSFMTPNNWLKSKQQEHVSERHEVLKTLAADAHPLQCAIAFNDEYQRLYGVRNAFYRGIESLPPELQDKLLASVEVSHVPGYYTRPPNTSPASHPINDDSLSRKLKLEYLYTKRNTFTHRLEQYHVASSPLAARFGASWKAVIQDSKLMFLYGHQDVIPGKADDAYVFSPRWPFCLFECVFH
jgi:hypothetical protein